MQDAGSAPPEPVAEIAGDRAHGAAWLSLRALRGLEERARALAACAGGADEAAAELRELGRALALARPAMVVLRHRVDRLMSSGDVRDPGAFAAVAAALAARAEAAERAVPPRRRPRTSRDGASPPSRARPR